MEKRWLLIFLLFEKSCFTTMAIMVDDDKLQKQGAEIEQFYALFFYPFDRQVPRFEPTPVPSKATTEPPDK